MMPSATAQLQVREGDLTLQLDEKPKVRKEIGPHTIMLLPTSLKGALNFLECQMDQ
jgi:hypothetical protein